MITVHYRSKVLRPKKYVCFRFQLWKKLGMVGRHNILFYKNILYWYCIFQYIFPDFSAFLTVFSSKFTIKCLGPWQKPKEGRETWNTHMFVLA